LADYNRAVASVQDAQNAYNIAWTNVQTSKAALDAANNALIQANADVVNAQNAVGLATQANDDAQNNLNVADAALTAAQHTLEDANAAVAALNAQFSEAATALGGAKFNYTQALNNLFVAQAAKEESDKAIAIAYAQGAASTNIFKGQSSYVFNGCLNQAYPSIAGTVSVIDLIPNGAQLSSGHVLTWGDCTVKGTVNIGDVIYYTGSIVGNSISAVSVTVHV
jgi:chromosome segregation ATPase